MQIIRYAFASVTPLAFLLVGAVFGGLWAGLALLWLTLLAAGLDQILPKPKSANHSRHADALSVVLAVGHLLLLALAVRAFSLPDRNWAETLTLFLGTASFFGQVSHPNAHELIHRVPRGLRRLGASVYTSILFGHHVSAHRLVHHVHVGTENDPNTPRANEGFWIFLPRAWIGSFQAGLAEERRRSKPGRLNPYVIWTLGGVLTLILAALVGGFVGVVGAWALGSLAGLQILLSDYIQHYGLRRLTLPNGRIEPVAAHHSWNAPQGFSSYLMVNAPAHSDHHMHPATPYDALDVPAEAPVLPWSLPVMAMIATMPRRWKAIMNKRAARVMERAEARLQS